MLNNGIIGVGNAGGQIAALTNKIHLLDAMAINSSENDLATLPDAVSKVLIGNSQGSGKERAKAKEFLKAKIIEILKAQEFRAFMDKDIVFVVSSCGGGTGSGIAPVLADLLRKQYPNVSIVLVGILPTLKEKAFTQANAAEYLDELYNSLTDASYMLYDNHTMTDLPDYQLLPSINEQVVSDIGVLTGKYQLPTRFKSIDENDMKSITNKPGRIVIAGLYDIKEKVLEDKSVDELLVQALKKSAHAELERDRKAAAIGIITNLSQKIYDKYGNDLPLVEEYMGKADIDFSHIVVNEESSFPNNAIVIFSGLSPINDRVLSIKEEIDEYLAGKKKEEDKVESPSLLSSINLSAMKDARQASKPVADSGADEIDVNDIFGKFGI